MTQSIEILVAKDGKVTIQTKGFAGTSCKAASESLEKALGLKQCEQLTAEFYSNQQSNSEHAREGQA